jgi:hypothetical protein
LWLNFDWQKPAWMKNKGHGGIRTHGYFTK